MLWSTPTSFGKSVYVPNVPLLSTFGYEAEVRLRDRNVSGVIPLSIDWHPYLVAVMDAVRSKGCYGGDPEWSGANVTIPLDCDRIDGMLWFEALLELGLWKPLGSQLAFNVESGNKGFAYLAADASGALYLYQDSVLVGTVSVVKVTLPIACGIFAVTLVAWSVLELLFRRWSAEEYLLELLSEDGAGTD
eukprot:TRINITY_DN4703_c0_g1_i2.p2 TRINITY_DN4703_c0_g1~~TRINITY_DN4703_c0_g1_i2.p2  ORF type:complete len:190 (+),score=22.16 TRINITY_DN4703_c0_g1_i2:1-570(+)